MSIDSGYDGGGGMGEKGEEEKRGYGLDKERWIVARDIRAF